MMARREWNLPANGLPGRVGGRWNKGTTVAIRRVEMRNRGLMRLLLMCLEEAMRAVRVDRAMIAEDERCGDDGTAVRSP